MNTCKLAVFLIFLIITTTLTYANGESVSDLVFEFGQSGQNDAEFGSIFNFDVNSQGEIFVADMRNHRIQIFDHDGTFLKKFGTHGSSDGQFNQPFGITIGPNDKIYVSDLYNHRIQIFDPTGNFINSFGSHGFQEGQFARPHEIAISKDGKIYVADQQNNRIQIFNSEGKYLSHITNVQEPVQIDINSMGHLYVVEEWGKTKIKIFDSEGVFLGTYDVAQKNNIEFEFLKDLSIGKDGTIYITDRDKNKVYSFDENGDLLFSLNVTNPQYLSIHKDFLYVSDYNNHSIKVFQLDYDENNFENPKKIPDWVKDTMEWYVDGLISENELINALQFLINEGILKVDS